jgi:hypothetical protein
MGSFPFLKYTHPSFTNECMPLRVIDADQRGQQFSRRIDHPVTKSPLL